MPPVISSIIYVGTFKKNIKSRLDCLPGSKLSSLFSSEKEIGVKIYVEEHV